MHNGTIFTIHTYIYTINSIQLLSVYFLNIRVSQLTKRIQDLQKDGDTARLRLENVRYIVAIIIMVCLGNCIRHKHIYRPTHTLQLHSYLYIFIDTHINKDYAVGCLYLSRPTQQFLWQVQFAVDDPRNEVEVIFSRKYVTMDSRPRVVTSGFYF